MSQLANLERKYLVALEEIKSLQARVVALQAQLDDLVHVYAAPLELRLTTREAALFEALLAQKSPASKERLLEMVYADRYGVGDEPEPKIIDVFVCKLRKKIARYNLQIETVWGRGYFMPPANKEIVREMNRRAALSAAA